MTKPKSVRWAAAIFIIAAALVISFSLLRDSSRALTQTGGEVSDSLNKNNRPAVNWREAINNAVTREVRELRNGAAADSANPGKGKTNLTEAVAQSIFGQIRNRDQSGLKPFQTLDPNDPASQKLIAEAAANLSDPNLIFDQAVEDKDLKVSPYNSREAKLQYLNAVSEDALNKFSDAKFQRTAEQILADINSSCLIGGPSIHHDIASTYQALINDYLKLAVPSEWIAFHKKIINFYKKSQSVYQSLADCSLDPVRGYMATQLLPQFFDELISIQRELNQKWADLSS